VSSVVHEKEEVVNSITLAKETSDSELWYAEQLSLIMDFEFQMFLYCLLLWSESESNQVRIVNVDYFSFK